MECKNCGTSLNGVEKVFAKLSKKFCRPLLACKQCRRAHLDTGLPLDDGSNELFLIDGVLKPAV